MELGMGPATGGPSCGGRCVPRRLRAGGAGERVGGALGRAWAGSEPAQQPASAAAGGAPARVQRARHAPRHVSQKLGHSKGRLRSGELEGGAAHAHQLAVSAGGGAGVVAPARDGPHRAHRLAAPHLLLNQHLAGRARWGWCGVGGAGEASSRCRVVWACLAPGGREGSAAGQHRRGSAHLRQARDGVRRLVQQAQPAADDHEKALGGRCLVERDVARLQPYLRGGGGPGGAGRAGWRAGGLAGCGAQGAVLLRLHAPSCCPQTVQLRSLRPQPASEQPAHHPGPLPNTTHPPHPPPHPPG
jgi:hypothetical protein